MRPNCQVPCQVGYARFCSKTSGDWHNPATWAGGVILDWTQAEHIFPAPGNFTVTPVATDVYGQTSSATWDIMVYAAMPSP